MGSKMPSTENIKAKLGLVDEATHGSNKLLHPWDNTNAVFENTNNSEWLHKQFLNQTIDSDNSTAKHTRFKEGFSLLHKSKQMHLDGINSK